MLGCSRLLTLAQRIDPHRADVYAARFAERITPDTQAFAYAVLLASAYPALAATLEASPEIVETISAEGHQVTRDQPGLRRGCGQGSVTTEIRITSFANCVVLLLKRGSGLRCASFCRRRSEVPMST
jgi:hypothetical protein